MERNLLHSLYYLFNLILIGSILYVFLFERKNTEAKFNLVIAVFTFTLHFFTWGLITFQFLELRTRLFDSHFIQWHSYWASGIVCFLTADFVFYFWHRLSHQVGFLWKFHSFHHSSKRLTWTSSYRSSAFEILAWTIIWGTVSCLLNVNPFYFNLFVGLIGLHGFVAHEMRLALPKILSSFLVLPQQHRIHHEIHGSRYNYGGILTIWDRVFKTYNQESTKSDLGTDTGQRNAKYQDWYFPRF